SSGGASAALVEPGCPVLEGAGAPKLLGAPPNADGGDVAEAPPATGVLAAGSPTEPREKPGVPGTNPAGAPGTADPAAAGAAPGVAGDCAPAIGAPIPVVGSPASGWPKKPRGVVLFCPTAMMRQSVVPVSGSIRRRRKRMLLVCSSCSSDPG